VINPILNAAVAVSRQQDSERKIAAAELQRLAKATRHAEGPSAPWDRVFAARLPRITAIRPVAGAWRSLCRGLVAVVGRRVPA
jgi:hypothetical protein